MEVLHNNIRTHAEILVLLMRWLIAIEIP